LTSSRTPQPRVEISALFQLALFCQFAERDIQLILTAGSHRARGTLALMSLRFSSWLCSATSPDRHVQLATARRTPTRTQIQGLALACAHLATTSFREAEFQRFKSFRARQRPSAVLSGCKTEI
jgi:1-deoxy-D-xylulose 5-phosphate reductoisomerase